MRTPRRIVWAASFLGVAAILLVAPGAKAQIPGPAGVGGVARRHVRRTVVVTSASASSAAASSQQQAAASQAAAQSAAASAAAAQSAAAATQAANAANAAQATPALASLPAGCTPAGQSYNCSGVYYRAYFMGGTLVYKQVSGP